jgi:hypothetical protein
MKITIAISLICYSAVVVNAQRVGIGTTTPSEKLHVVGNIKADTLKPGAIRFSPDAGSGKVLTSDADGNAAWASSGISGGAGFGSWGDCNTNAIISAYQPAIHPAYSSSDGFGKSASISGDYALIGAQADDVGINSNQGSAGVFHFDGYQWTFAQLLTDAAGGAEDLFGFSVSLSGNIAVIGSPYDDVGTNTDQGSVSIFQFNGTSWVFVQKLTDPAGSVEDYFGYSVCVEGNTILVGTYLDDAGAVDKGSASVYRYNGSSWIFSQLLTDPTGAAGDLFGRSVALSANYAIIGAYGDDVGANVDQGSASIFQFNGSNWVFMQQLIDPLGAASDNLGWSVAISADMAFAGAYRDDNVATNQGSVSAFRYSGGTWLSVGKFEDTTPGNNEQFGYHLCVSGNYLLIGENKDANNRGSASLYYQLGTVWHSLQYITDPFNRIGDELGGAVAIDAINRRFVIGASGYAGNSGKVIFGKIN